MHINLIGENSRKEIKLRRVYKSFSGILYFFAVLSIFSSLFFYLVAYVLRENYQNINSHESNFSENAQSYVSKTKELNQNFGEILLLQNDFTPLACFIKEIFNAVPDGILIENFSLSKEKESFAISGRADSRDVLLELKSNLEEMEEIKSINLPFEDLLEKENIEFQLTGELKSFE